MKFMPTKKEWKWVIGIVLGAIATGILVGAIVSGRLKSLF